MRDSEKINEEMTRIYKRDGKVKASVVLAESMPKDAPLHHLFEWDDSAAGHEYRLIQARQMIRVAVVNIDKQPLKLHHVHIATNDKKKTREGYYQVAKIIVNNELEYQTALKEALFRLKAAKRAVDDLEAAAKKSDKPDLLARLGLAQKAMDTAYEALRH